MSEADRQALFEQTLERHWNAQNPGDPWNSLGEARRDRVRNSDRNREIIDRIIKNQLGDEAWNALDADGRANATQAAKTRKLIGLLGQAAWNLLSEQQRRAACDNLAVHAVENARASVKKAIALIACHDPDVAACLRRTWNTGGFCIDFNSPGATGSILPNCEGKPEGCQPGSNPINISVRILPCHRVTDCYDPSFYLLFTTLLHEGVHAMQAWSAKADRQPSESARNEVDAHGRENAFIDLLCDALRRLKRGLARRA